MIWNDDKITRLMSMGMMHGGRGDDASSSAGGSGESSSDDTGGGEGFSGTSGDSFGGLGDELSVDLGGGVSIGINSVTGDVTSTRGGGEGGVEGALAEVEQPSAFGKFISNLDPSTLAKAGFGLAGLLTGGPALAVAAAKLGGGLFGDKDKGLSQLGPGGAPAQAAQQAPGQPQQLAGVPSAGGLAGGGLPDSQLGGGESQPALQLAAAGRQSGIAAAPAQAPVNPFLSQRPQFQGLPQVNLGQFPNALGRV